jgi:hypothetical protein
MLLEAFAVQFAEGLSSMEKSRFTFGAQMVARVLVRCERADSAFW